jgi:hypothetical protein
VGDYLFKEGACFKIYQNEREMQGVWKVQTKRKTNRHAATSNFATPFRCQDGYLLANEDVWLVPGWNEPISVVSVQKPRELRFWSIP